VIEVSHLTKRFARTTAVDDLSFEVARGEIVGVLGPNGAGKTTTLRVLAGYLPATGGDVRVAGHDVVLESLEVRRHIGYLPENCPLPGDLRVDEYLRFRAALKGVPARRVRRRVAEVRELCGLAGEGRRMIGRLSKGYRQRVGMADALVHEPEVLVLDEPTIGLDPNQIRQARELIRGLAPRHTVLLSTHILPEVEMTCGRVLILDRGRLAASDSTENLRRLLEGRARVALELRAPGPEAAAALAAVADVQRVETSALADGWLCARVEYRGDADPRPALAEAIARRGWPLRELRRERQSLEDAFVALTRRDEGGAP
jgi:ABC-2 type transport system ATP-binding protein